MNECYAILVELDGTIHERIRRRDREFRWDRMGQVEISAEGRDHQDRPPCIIARSGIGYEHAEAMATASLPYLRERQPQWDAEEASTDDQP